MISLGRSTVQPSFAAGLALVALDLLVARGLTGPTATALISALGASRTRAYAAKERLLEQLPALAPTTGRPAAEPAPMSPDVAHVAAEVVDFLMRHPGCVHRGDRRTRYSDAFRAFAVALTERHAGLSLDALATALQVPESTLEDWRRPAVPPAPEPEPVDAPADAPAADGLTEARIATVVAAWRSWSGDFVPFCTHVQRELRLPFGRDLIRHILFATGVRIPRHRRGRSPDEEALRRQFSTFFPGFQWVGDGTSLPVEIEGERHEFNLELMVDADSGAFTGMSIRDTEDAAAVVEAFDDGVVTTGQPPAALLLDNRPSNHTEAVGETLGDTVKLAATPARPQNKAHVEGAFGLFSQTAPELRISSREPRQLARSVLALVVLTWARTLNHKPRPNRGDKSRVQLYKESTPTQEQIDAARQHLDALLERQERARQTREARLDPDLRALLDAAFARLGLDDPERRFRDALIRYPANAIVAGIAIFEGKRKAGTLPDGVDARYLVGIVRNVSDEEEGFAIASALFDRRVELRDLALIRLQCVRNHIAQREKDVISLLATLVDQATTADRFIDRDFWLRAVADAIRDEPAPDQRRLFLVAARRIQARHALAKRHRDTAVRRLAALLIPIA